MEWVPLTAGDRHQVYKMNEWMDGFHTVLISGFNWVLLIKTISTFINVLVLFSVGSQFLTPVPTDHPSSTPNQPPTVHKQMRDIPVLLKWTLCSWRLTRQRAAPSSTFFYASAKNTDSDLPFQTAEMTSFIHPHSSARSSKTTKLECAST